METEARAGHVEVDGPDKHIVAQITELAGHPRPPCRGAGWWGHHVPRV